MLLRIPVGLCVIAVSACGSDDPSGSGDDPDFTMTVVEHPEETTLGTTTPFAIQVRSREFTGTVTLSVSGAPADWEVELEDMTVELTTGATVVVDGTITVPSDGTASEDGRLVTVTGTSAALSHVAIVSATVADEYVIPIPAGTGASADHWTEIGPTVTIRTGTLLRIRNDDGTPHRVHTTGNIAGLPHQDASMPTGQSYTGTPTEPGADDDIYCHDHGGETFTLVVE